MSWFRAFRAEDGYTWYGENRTVATVDLAFIAVIYACALISFAGIIAAIGVRGKERLSTFIRVTYSTGIGSIILLSLFGNCWQHGNVVVNSLYVYRSTDQFDGSLDLEIGLKSANITMRGNFHGTHSSVAYNEKIRYSEVGEAQKEFLGQLESGLPMPLLSISEYFSIDEGGLRWGRSFRAAGNFAYMLLWTSFAFWVVTNIILCCVVYNGAVMFSLTGLAMVLAPMVYHGLQPSEVFLVHVADKVIRMRYGWCFWINLVAGSMTLILGLLLLLFDFIFPIKVAAFFLLENNQLVEDDSNHNLSGSPNVNTKASEKKFYLVDSHTNKGFVKDLEIAQLNRKLSSIESGRDDKVLEEIKFDSRRVSSSTSLAKLPEIYESYELTNEAKEPYSIKNNGSSGNVNAAAESELLDNVFDDDVNIIVCNNGSQREATPENDYVEIDVINGSAAESSHNKAHHNNIVK